MSVLVTCLKSPSATLKGRLVNLSAHGLSVIVDRELPEGSFKIQWGTCEFVGELIYCESHGTEFLAGMEVESPVYDTSKLTTTSKTLS